MCIAGLYLDYSNYIMACLVMFLHIYYIFLHFVGINNQNAIIITFISTFSLLNMYVHKLTLNHPNSIKQNLYVHLPLSEELEHLDCF